MPTRRTILKDSLRWASLASLAGLTTILARRSLRHECTTAGPCGSCPMFSGCGLPKAKSAKQSADQPPYPPNRGNA